MILPKTENEMLREKCAMYERELRKIDLETAHAAIERRAQIAKDEEAKAAAEQAAREAVALEEHRRNAWLNFRIDQCHEAADPNGAFLALLGRANLFADTP